MLVRSQPWKVDRPRVELVERLPEPGDVRTVRPRDDVEIAGRAAEAVLYDGNTADDDEVDVVAQKRPQQLDDVGEGMGGAQRRPRTSAFSDRCSCVRCATRAPGGMRS
jgi:hypothetical protein